MSQRKNIEELKFIALGLCKNRKILSTENKNNEYKF